MSQSWCRWCRRWNLRCRGRVLSPVCSSVVPTTSSSWVLAATKTSSFWEPLVVRIASAKNTAKLAICQQREVRCASGKKSFHLLPASIASVDSRLSDGNEDAKLGPTPPGGIPFCTRSRLRIDSHSLPVKVSMIDACDVEASDVFDCTTIISCDVPRSPFLLEVCGGPAVGPLSAVSESAYFSDVVNSARYGYLNRPMPTSEG